MDYSRAVGSHSSALCVVIPGVAAATIRCRRGVPFSVRIDRGHSSEKRVTSFGISRAVCGWFSFIMTIFVIMEPNRRVLLGMSGGTDSSVAALLLQDAGYEVV